MSGLDKEKPASYVDDGLSKINSTSQYTAQLNIINKFRNEMQAHDIICREEIIQDVQQEPLRYSKVKESNFSKYIHPGDFNIVEAK